VASECRTGGHW